MSVRLDTRMSVRLETLRNAARETGKLVREQRARRHMPRSYEGAHTHTWLVGSLVRLARWLVGGATGRRMHS